MRRVSTSKDQLEYLNQALVLSGAYDVANIGVTLITGDSITLAYTTDDPAITVDGAVTIADGDLPTAAEEVEMVEELIAEINKLNADLTSLNQLFQKLVRNATVNVYDLSVNTNTADANVSSTDIFTITYTTDDPAITRNGAVVVADGDLTTAAEFLEYFEEASEMMAKYNADLGAIRAEINRIISSRSFAGVSVPAALTGASGGVTVTYTTDDPAITPDGTVTIADGDTLAVAERSEVMEEVTAEMVNLYTDLNVLRTDFVALLTYVGIDN